MAVMWDQLKAPNIFASFEEGVQEARAKRREDTYDAYQKERIEGERMDRQNQAADRATADADRQRAGLGRAAVANAVKNKDMAGARSAAIGAGDPKLLDAISKMEDDERENLKQRNEIQGAALNSLRDPNTGQLLPDAAQRWDNMKQRFMANGWKPDELDFDPLQPGVIDAEIAEAMELKDILARAETNRHNREMEGIQRGRAESYDYSARRPRAGRGGGGRGGGGKPAGPRPTGRTF